MLKCSVLSLAFCLCTIATSSTHAKRDTLVMGFKDVAKGELIGDVNNNEGLYKELYEKAAAKIGLNLRIVRLPKMRIHTALSKGLIDFYPGASFSKGRTKYLYYLPNGLKTKEVLVSSLLKADITNMNNVSGKLIAGPSSSKINWDTKYDNLSIKVIKSPTILVVIREIQSKGADFYVADIEMIDSYKKNNKIKKYSGIGIKIHYNAINKNFISMYFGFSRQSSFYSERPNPRFIETEELSIKNFPTLITKESVAYKLYLALQELEKDGTTKRLYDKYHKNQ